MDAAARTDAHDGFRPDIEGLRGIAVLLVVLFHSSLVVGLPGGFIGVDVFFVISGFLITGLLVRERERTGGISLPKFYARRVRRLLPAGMFALACTLVASFIVLAPLDRAGAATDAAAAALSVGNVRFALEAGDYFASVAAPSPFLHYWSLGVEEQFYLLWPALVFAASRGARPRLGAGIALAVVLVVSLGANLVVSDIAVNWAFYSLPTRAWQLALGGLIAVGAGGLERVPRLAAAGLGWLGLVTIAVAAALLDGGIAYPGPWALAPTLGAAALLVAGMTRFGPGRAIATRPLRFFGRISYSLYLWHWPVLVLPMIALETEPPIEVRVGLVALAVVAAWLSWRWIEEPFRKGLPVLARYPGRTVLAGATAVLAVVVASGGFVAAADRVPGLMPELGYARDQDQGEAEVGAPGDAGDATIDPGDATVDDTAADVTLVDEDSGGDWVALPADEREEAPEPKAVTGSPDPTATATAPAGIVTSKPPKPVIHVRLPKDIRPSLAKARGDEERLRGDGCLAFEGVRTPPDCVYGDKKGKVTVALVGDSHAAQWFPALEAIAVRNHWRLVVFTKVACPFLDMRVSNLALKREYTECADYRERTIKKLRTIEPDLVLVSMSRFAIHPMRKEDASVRAAAAALARTVADLPGRVVLLTDTPDAGRDVPSCLSRHTGDARACAVRWKIASRGSLGKMERLASEASGAGLIDLTAHVCRARPCPVAVDGMIVFRDLRHLTATFSASLAPDLERAMVRYMDSLVPVAPSPSAAPADPAAQPPVTIPVPPTTLPAPTTDRPAAPLPGLIVR